MQTIQQRMKLTLESCGLPFHEIAVYGSQITVETKSLKACNRWVMLLGKFAKYRGMVESVAYNKVQRGTNLMPTTYKIWRAYASIV